MTRILISGTFGIGGIQTQVTMLCRLLRQVGAHVTCVPPYSEWPPSAVEEVRELGVVVHLPRWGKAEALLTWPFKLKRHFDVVYCIGQGRLHRFARTFLKRGGIAIYHEILGCPASGSVAAETLRVMDAVVANSQFVGRAIEECFPTKHVRVIPFLTSLKSVPEPPQRDAVGDRELRVTYLGRLAPQKRAERLVREWRELTRLGPLGPARLDLYGDDTTRLTLVRLRQLVANLGLNDVVHFHGAYSHSELPLIFRRSDLVVLPSEWEGLPLVLVEAMQHGVPIAATDAGGTAELGLDNPDVVITRVSWDDFVEGLNELSAKLRAGVIDSRRLHGWTERRYGYNTVSQQWLSAISQPRSFFDLDRIRRK